MKQILDIRNLLIIILVAVAVVEFINPKGIMPNRIKLVPQVDSIPYAVHDTVGIETPVEVEVPVEVKVPYAVHDTVPLAQVVDTSAILRLFAENKQTKKDVLKLPEGTVTIFDTISNNKILNRTYTSNIKQKIVRDTSYLPEPRKTAYYFGVDAKFDKPNVINLIGVGLVIKDKDDRHLYKIGVGVSNKISADNANGELIPFFGGSVYWKIKKRN